MDPRLYP